MRAALLRKQPSSLSPWGAHASAVISGHAIHVTLAWAALAMALVVGGGAWRGLCWPPGRTP
jgi:hypothetical protein